ncbi:MAG: ABC transporter ATP-binding protein [Candidatus Pacebacteria bacterium]|jgi:putative ABC transport system ATP-binding protein|nr:ABC transporter ATP-binding protein [Candidatus Paceibacterota bacterium]
MIQVQNLKKIFVTKHVETSVLKGISLSIPEGQFVAIMGKSGAGKSTLMYQMGLLDHPTAGTIEIDGIHTDTLSQNARTKLRLNSLGYIFQDYALVPELTALENVMVPLLMQGLSKEDARRDALAALVKIGLGHRHGNLPSQLSGGEQQRVSIARAVAHKPKIVFADEPTANLDNAASKVVIEIFRDLHAQGQTIVMVTHEPEYTTYCDRIIHLDDGLVVSDEIRKH